MNLFKSLILVYGSLVGGVFAANTIPTYFKSGVAASAVSVGKGVTAADTKSVLDLVSTTKGILPPRMTTTQKNAISSPPEGLAVYDTTLHVLAVYNGSSWLTGGGGTPKLSDLTAATGTNTINNFSYAQEWQWNSLTTETAMKLSSSSVTTGTLLNVTNSFSSSTSTGDIAQINSSGSSSRNTALHIVNAGGTNSRGIFIEQTGTSASHGLYVDSNTTDSGTILAAFIQHGAGYQGVLSEMDHAGSAGKGLAVYTSHTTGTAKAVEAKQESSSASAITFDGIKNHTSAAGPIFKGTFNGASATGTGVLITHNGSGGWAGDLQSTGTGAKEVLQLQNFVTAANDSGAQLTFSGNRTTSGLTKVAGVEGRITDITDAAYKGALLFKTANNAAPAERMRINNVGHIITVGTAPSITADCGTTPSVAGTDVNGRITVGTGGTDVSCTLTFANGFATAPTCTVGDETTSLLVTGVASTTTLIISAALPFTASDKLVYNCFGY